MQQLSLRLGPGLNYFSNKICESTVSVLAEILEYFLVYNLSNAVLRIS